MKFFFLERDYVYKMQKYTFSLILKNKASGFYNNLYSQVQYVMLQEVMLQEVMFYPCVREASPLHSIYHKQIQLLLTGH